MNKSEIKKLVNKLSYQEKKTLFKILIEYNEEVVADTGDSFFDDLNFRQSVSIVDQVYEPSFPFTKWEMNQRIIIPDLDTSLEAYEKTGEQILQFEFLEDMNVNTPEDEFEENQRMPAIAIAVGQRDGKDVGIYTDYFLTPIKAKNLQIGHRVVLEEGTEFLLMESHKNKRQPEPCLLMEPVIFELISVIHRPFENGYSCLYFFGGTNLSNDGPEIGCVSIKTKEKFVIQLINSEDNMNTFFDFKDRDN